MPGRALILEDREEVAEVLAELLDDIGFVTVQAKTVADGLAELDKAPAPNFVLVDYWLPDGLGLRVAAEAGNRGIAFCIITGDTLIGDRLQQADLPVIGKPFDLPLFEQAIARLRGADSSMHQRCSAVVRRMLADFECSELPRKPAGDVQGRLTDEFR